MNSFPRHLVYALGITLATAAPTLAEPANWAIAPGEDGHSLNFFYEDISNAEDLGLRLVCAHDEGDASIGTSLMIISDDKNATAAKALVDFNPFGDDAAAHLVFGTTAIPAPIWAFKLEADAMNGAWDLTLDFSDGDGELIKKLAAATKPGPIQLVVVGQTFDLTPRPADFAAFKKFAAKC
ncbi:hypothetical protein [Devosia sp.]|uniref:hypothetical protein n=1 Tax=Devosia sp. TaxID=1871048 RepID=UPI0032678999